MNFKSIKVALTAFVIVLLLMPIGHTLMILNEKLLLEQKYLGAFIIGILGLLMLIIGVRNNSKMALATIMGLIGGVLVWTGWIEFSFVWTAEKLAIPGLFENGEVTTKPEYLVMMSSVGLLLSFVLLFLFSQTRCTFFNWFQKTFKYKQHLKMSNPTIKPTALITFIETVMLLWFFYLVLLFVYDKDIAGDKHPATYIVAFGSLFWSIYLMLRLAKINKLDYAIRYAVPTVIIFWNFIEVIGRWDLFKEIWVHPEEHWLENSLILLMLAGFITLYFVENKRKAKQKLQKKEHKMIEESVMSS
ncbi:MAG TPA: hypothetical protein PKX92_01465 [Edaphocola sp.]|nr:hypothetical protein [Edaphocola sp.]